MVLIMFIIIIMIECLVLNVILVNCECYLFSFGIFMKDNNIKMFGLYILKKKYFFNYVNDFFDLFFICL